jgi:5-(carboxyamino)imidazole ribonucleotide synthase
VIAPGATIGIFGGGQLGRMTALAARSLGYRIHVLDPDAQCATAAVADRVISAPFDDPEAARELARHCDVLTLEIEQIGTAGLDAAAAYAPVRPASSIIGVIQDRVRQKEWLSKNGFPVGAYRVINAESDVAAAIRAMGDSFFKSARGGYDGRGQGRSADASQSAGIWSSVGKGSAIAEQALSLAGELSVMTARRPGGDVVVFPPALNHHERHILAWSVIPAPLPTALVQRATEIGRAIAEQLGVEGLLAVELFLTQDGELLVNELAPRPHNSFHATERACVTSQFEQLTRAVCDLPLGDVGVLRPAAIVNLFGELWHNGTAPDFPRALENRSVRLHLYGKAGPRKGRKMGHLSAIGGSAMEALRCVREAGARIGAVTEPVPNTLEAFGVKG